MQPIIDVRGLTYSYPQEKTPVLNHISFQVKQHEVFGIVGPSGCGKSTLMLALSGLIPHQINGDLQGTISVAGKDTQKQTMPELAQQVQILFQSPESQLFALNVEDDITFGLENLNLPWKHIEQIRDRVIDQMSIDLIRPSSL